jgi:ribosomal protein S18 acetylase RimI-like enzyme
VHSTDLVGRRVARRESYEQLAIAPELTFRSRDTGVDGFEPGGPLGMPAARVVFGEERVLRDKQHRRHRTLARPDEVAAAPVARSTVTLAQRHVASSSTVFLVAIVGAVASSGFAAAVGKAAATAVASSGFAATVGKAAVAAATGTMSAYTLRWRGGWVRVAPWRHDADVAHLTVGVDAPPSLSEIERCVAALRAGGYHAVVTSAIGPAAFAPFVDAGFVVRERLHLLVHDLDDLPRSISATRRARRSDRSAILTLDAHAFDDFWRIDDDALTDTVRATPATRFRVTTGRPAGREVSGYAITGHAGRRGYLQRVAVDPAARQRGFGRALVVDALRWLRRRASARAMVNTQLDNAPALALYESCGFRRLPVGLSVLGRAL